ncbi:MAG: DUF11 domain-containing protein, partial [Candidatus Thermoplasmatota archaeon]|nr:DUF11 domain-containing protein [Candidatus Thermoplasmatota archaeon]
MKKAKKNGASIFVIFCLIFSSISVVTSVSADTTGTHGQMEVIKEVFNGNTWSEGPISASIGDTLEFRITLTYHNNSGLPRFHYAYAIRVNDSLPDCLDYNIGSAIPNLYSWTDDPNETLYWDFGAKPLNDTESLVIKYNATVVESTLPMPQENNATVLWNEVCTGGVNLIAFDTLTITISEEPELNLIKRVWDPVKSQYVHNISTDEGETLHFRIDVNNVGPTNLTGVIVKDSYPEFITPIEYYPSYTLIDTINRIITWNLGTIPAHTSKIILFNATVNTIGMKITGKNFANVTCNQQLFDEDNVTITVEKHFIVDKKVRHPDTGEWVDEIPYVKRCEPVRFRINLTYFGTDMMKCLVVNDTLPMECLNYSDNLYIEIAGNEITPGSIYYPDIYTEGDTVEMCCTGSVVVVPEGSIYFSWTNKSIGLIYGDSVIIEFDATVIKYCEDSHIIQNCVEAWLWGCNCDNGYYGKDCVDINCIALPGDFNKTVSPDVQPPNWGEEVYTTQGDYILFKLKLTYYGNDNLTNASFLDELCCLLEYDKTIQSPAGTEIDVSADKKTIWWNVTQNITDCESIEIIFRVKVTGGSDCGGCTNFAHAYGYIWCGVLSLVVDRTDTATIYAEPNSPPGRPDVSGPQEGVVGATYSFKAMLTDPDGDQLYYIFSWGDGSDTGWLGPVSPGEVTQTHTYTAKGN